MQTQKQLDEKGLKVTLVEHPLVQHKLSLMREKSQPVTAFRSLLREISWLLCFEVCRDLPLEMKPIETPVEAMDAPVLKGKKLAFISILRAGNGLLDGMLDVIPSARVGHVGLYRDPETLEAVEYYYKAVCSVRSWRAREASRTFSGRAQNARDVSPSGASEGKSAAEN